MIKSKEGFVTVEGTEPEILAETMGILDAVYQMLLENHSEDHAKARIESLGKLYVMRQEEKKAQQPSRKMNYTKKENFRKGQR